MLEALAVVHNFSSSAEVSVLEFGEFTLRRIDASNYDTYRTFFTSGDVFFNDWVYSRFYPDRVLASPIMSGSLKGIPQDTEDVLFLLRLYKVGDIGFHNQIVRSPGGRTKIEQAPYSNMNALNRNSVFTTELEPEECPKFIEFANGIRSSQSWGAPWFSIARRYFMYGSGKEYMPQWDEVDRIVNYGTALEATLTPEQDFTKNRFMNRATRLMAENDGDSKATLSRMKELYNMRSTIVHGRGLVQENIEWLTDNAFEIELATRNILTLGVQYIPAEEEARKVYLSQLYDVEDSKHGEATWNAFCQIETPEVQQETIKSIAKRMKWECGPKP
jgi:hypothetical protein